jgi:hypothetical protein
VRRALLCTFCVGLLLPSCKRESSRGDATVRDSLGVTIVESRRPVWSASDAWTVSATPALRIGVVEGDPHYQFFRIAGVRRLSTGEIVVADGGSHTIRWYDGAGRFLQSVGGPGDGPGEYRWLGGLVGLPGDSILAKDPQRHRVSLYGPSGRLIRSWVIQPLRTYVMPPPIGRVRDGRFIAMTESGQSSPYGYVRYQALLVRYQDSAVVDTIAQVAGSEAYYLRCPTRPNAICNYAPLFALQIHAAVSGDRIAIGNGDEYAVSVFDPSGALSAVYRRVIPRAKLPELWVTTLIDSAVGMQRPQDQPAVRRALEEVPRREYVPAYTDLLFDQLGCLWVARTTGPGDATRPWDVFDTRGSLLGTVTLPTALRVKQVDDEYILGVEADANQVEFVVLYRLTR